jgi:hypothetical protein
LPFSLRESHRMSMALWSAIIVLSLKGVGILLIVSSLSLQFGDEKDSASLTSLSSEFFAVPWLLLSDVCLCSCAFFCFFFPESGFVMGLISSPSGPLSLFSVA